MIGAFILFLTEEHKRKNTKKKSKKITYQKNKPPHDHLGFL